MVSVQPYVAELKGGSLLTYQTDSVPIKQIPEFRPSTYYIGPDRGF